MDQHNERNLWIAPQLRSLSASRAAAGATLTFANEVGHIFVDVGNYAMSGLAMGCGPGPVVGPS
jgi:hypothetical protein